jgi:hypothetical protein
VRSTQRCIASAHNHLIGACSPTGQLASKGAVSAVCHNACLSLHNAYLHHSHSICVVVAVVIRCGLGKMEVFGVRLAATA